MKLKTKLRVISLLMTFVFGFTLTAMILGAHRLMLVGAIAYLALMPLIWIFEWQYRRELHKQYRSWM